VISRHPQRETKGLFSYHTPAVGNGDISSTLINPPEHEYHIRINGENMLLPQPATDVFGAKFCFGQDSYMKYVVSAWGIAQKMRLSLRNRLVPLVMAPDIATTKNRYENPQNYVHAHAQPSKICMTSDTFGVRFRWGLFFLGSDTRRIHLNQAASGFARRRSQNPFFSHQGMAAGLRPPATLADKSPRHCVAGGLDPIYGPLGSYGSGPPLRGGPLPGFFSWIL